jgi:Mycothiol maleylpyruvate isomerase N-terminal domain
VNGRELMAAEDAGWAELHALVESLPAEQAERPGYFAEGWSVKDLLGHVGSWLAEAAAILERIRTGTHRPDELDIDALNAHFLEIMRDLPLATVRVQAWAARTRMLQAWAGLPELTPVAREWIEKAGAEHYDEHLPRLREWVAELLGA